MKRWFILGIVIILFIILLSFIIPKSSNVPGSEFEVLIKNLDTPWAIDFLPNGDMIFTERPGRVSVFDFNEVKVVSEIEVVEKSEAGLLGIAVDPQFDKNNFIYVYYTSQSSNQVSRFTLNNDKLEDEFILLSNIPNAKFHDGGRIKFGPDGYLYVTTGDATIPSSAQDLKSLSGKILRMDTNGIAAKDNPFGNYVYSYGHRNPQGLAWHPVSEQLYSAEHGPSRRDEVNLIIPGENYGWPVTCDEASDFVDPLRCYTDFTLAPGGIAFYNNDLYVAGLRGNQLRRIVFGDDYKTIIKEEKLFSNLGRIREVVSQDGYLYIATSNRDGRAIPKISDDRIIRVKI